MNVCRFCLGNNELHPLFESHDHINRSKTLYIVTGCKIGFHDGLPQWICRTCTVLVDGALKLRELSHYSEKILCLANANKEIKAIQETKLNNNDLNEIHELADLQEELDNDNIKNDKEESKNEYSKDGKQESDVTINLKTVSDGDTPKKARKRQPMPQEKLQKYLSLAVTPYDSKGAVACLICRKELKTLRYFINHAKTHFAAEHTCADCGKKFVSPHSMRYHMMRLHGLEKRHPCQHCDFRGVDLDQLRNHVRRVHTQERPYACEACGAAFALPAGLRQHARIHGAPKTEQCERCSAMFRSRSELAGHRRRVHARARADRSAAPAQRPRAEVK